MFAKKNLGQNFLMHQRTAERIADSACLSKKDTVLEIGPGTGKLTSALLARAEKVIAVEKDDKLIKILSEKFAEDIAKDKLVLIPGDVRTFNTSDIQSDYFVVANIPYYITGVIIRKFLEDSHQPKSMTLLIQKEVAERVVRDPKESLLSVSIKIYGTPRYVFTVPRGAFNPAPKVDSAVINISSINNPFKTKGDAVWFFKVLHAGFAHKRKKLAKNLQDLDLNMHDIQAVFKKVGVDLNIRAENITPKEWYLLSTLFHY